MRLAGFVFAVLVAALAVVATRTPTGCGSVYLYSTCAALLCLFFIAVGGALTAAGVMFKTPTSYVTRGNPIGDAVLGCEEFMADVTSGSGEGYCEAKKLCATLRYLSDKTSTFVFGAGVPLFVAGPLPPLPT